MYMFRDNNTGELMCSEDEYPDEARHFHIERFAADMDERDMDELYASYEADDNHLWLETSF